jgi:hypothetical protein
MIIKLILWPMAILPWIASALLARNGDYRHAIYWFFIGALNYVARGM